jgi:hypothetical protein
MLLTCESPPWSITAQGSYIIPNSYKLLGFLNAAETATQGSATLDRWKGR